MPLKQIDYSKGLIYTIIHVNDTSLNYVGSTTSFVDRKTKHKHNCKSYQTKLYVMIRDNGGWEMFKIMPYKEFPCQSSTELHIEEERCRLELNATLNTQRCHRTEEQKKDEKKEYDKEYRIENADKLKENKKEYCVKNKEDIKEKCKKYYDDNKEQILEKTKEYYIENSDKIKEYKKEYRIKNAKKLKEKYTCQCGSLCGKIEKSRHELTKKHINFMENK